MVNMSYTALYRQFRPVVFEEVTGQEHITVTLKNQIMDGRIAHAYLFAGIRGTGKTSTAKIFARAVNCIDRTNGNPCNSCTVCSKALTGSLMDIIEIDAASNRGVDEIRDLREKVKYLPSSGRYRVYIIDEVHMLTVEAFNALLKTLEEPPAHVIFILATTEPYKLPPTILSRCQRFDFRRISVAGIIDRLNHIAGLIGLEIEEEAVELIARNADGALRDALSMLDQCLTFQKENRLTFERVISILGMASFEFLAEMSEGIVRKNAAACMELLNRALEEGKDVGQLFKDLIYHFRDLLMVKVSGTGILETTGERARILGDIARKMEVPGLIRIINILSEGESKAKWAFQPRIYLEISIIKICQPSMDHSLEGLQERISRLEVMLSRGGLQSTERILEGNADVEPAGRTRKKSGKPDSEEACEKAVSSVAKKEHNAGGENNKAGEEPSQDSGEGRISLEQVEKVWKEILEDLEKSKKGLYTLIKDARPIKVSGTHLKVGCKSLHGIYRDIVNSKENLEALKAIILTRVGANLELSIESIDEKACQPLKPEETGKDFDLVRMTREVFGEDLVEVIEDIQEEI